MTRTPRPTIAETAQPLVDVRRINGIRAAIRDGATGLALTLLDGWLAEEPERGDLHLLKGVAFEQEARFAEAKSEFLRASRLLPKNPEPILRTAKLANQQNLPAEELRLLRTIVPLDPANEKVLRRILVLEWETRDLASAVATANRVLALAPADAKVMMRKVWSLYELGRKTEAEAILDNLLRAPIPEDDYILGWSEMLCDREERDVEVEPRLRELCARVPNSWVPWGCLGKLLHKLDKLPESAEAFRKAVELKPDHAVCWFDIGVVERQRGRDVEALEALNRTLQIDPLNPGALRIAGYEHRYAYGDESFKRINRALALLHNYPVKLQVEIHYAAAKAFEDVGELDTAFDHYARAGQLQKQITPWSELQMNGVLGLMRQFVSRQVLERAREQGSATTQPVFVFGMPRSGTTLIEQVIASHPQAFGAGELKLGAMVLNGIQMGPVTIETSYGNAKRPDNKGLSISERGRAYLSNVQKIAGGDYTRIVDKMPGNYHWAGLLDTILPGCFLIHSRRHPVDTCLSQYRIFFPDGIPYSYDLRDLGKAYRQYIDYMKYWCKMLPKHRILHVRYEDMVTDFERQAQRIIAFVELPWDDACLRFYESERIVKTASVTQVRRPIYTDSMGRWRKFAPYLKPLLDELGPLVREYEEELEGNGPSPFD
jgi:tetratricopeptide (TPR) repeat protein